MTNAKIISGPTRGSFTEQNSDEKIQSDGKLLERVEKVHGQWILLVIDWDAMIDFHGLPDTLRKNEEDDDKPHIWLPDNYMEKQQELENWERVYRVHAIGDLAWGTGDNKEEPRCKVGDLVLAKGTVTKTYSNPTLWFVGKDNIACTIDPNKLKSLAGLIT